MKNIIKIITKITMMALIAVTSMIVLSDSNQVLASEAFNLPATVEYLDQNASAKITFHLDQVHTNFKVENITDSSGNEINLNNPSVHIIKNSDYRFEVLYTELDNSETKKYEIMVSVKDIKEVEEGTPQVPVVDTTGKVSIRATQWLGMNLAVSDTFATGTIIASSGGGSHHTITVSNGGGSKQVYLAFYTLLPDNTNVFCIEPFVNTSDGENYNPFGGDLNAILPFNERDIIRSVSFFGYGYNGDYSDLARAGTTVAIYEARGYTVSDISAQTRAMANTINQRKNDHFNGVKPSFDGESIILNGYGIENAKTIKDTNGQFNEWFDSSNPGNFKMLRSGDHVTIYAEEGTSSLSAEVKYQKINPETITQRGIDVVYTSPNNAQKLMSIKGFDPAMITFNVKLAIGSAKISKLDAEDRTDLIGSHLQVEDLNGNVKDSWVSDGTAHTTAGLVAGKYKLVETKATDGYLIAEPVEFEVLSDGEVVPVEMLDEFTTIQFAKYEDVLGEKTKTFVEGSEIDLLRKSDDSVVHTFTTADDFEEISKLVIPGETYIFKEVKAPVGMKLAEPVEFVVEDTADVQKVVMYDEVIHKDFFINKVDSITKEALISADLEFTAYLDEACSDVYAVEKQADGVVNFKLRYGTYYFKETKAPIGYILSQEVVKVIVDEDGVKVEMKDEAGKVIEELVDSATIEFENTMMTSMSTGDTTNINQIILLMGFSGMIILAFVLKSKKRAIVYGELANNKSFLGGKGTGRPMLEKLNEYKRNHKKEDNDEIEEKNSEVESIRQPASKKHHDNQRNKE